MCGDVSNENDFICISLSFEENLSLQRVYVVLIGQSLSFLVQTFQTEGVGAQKKKSSHVECTRLFHLVLISIYCDRSTIRRRTISITC